MPFTAMQRMSPKQSFEGVDLARTEIALSPQPGQTGMIATNWPFAC
jgi:hypothetical protein